MSSAEAAEEDASRAHPPPSTAAAAAAAAQEEGLVLLAQGAEARVYVLPSFLGGRPAIVKERFAKSYRLPELDRKLTGKRVMGEVRCMLRCAKAGVRTPCVYLVDQAKSRIYMEMVEGPTLKHFLRDRYDAATGLYDEAALGAVRQLGRAIARIHDAEVVHGDPTTSNFLVVEEERGGEEIEGKAGAATTTPRWRLVAIDFGLGFQQPLAEDKAVDLYVLERAFLSTHPHSQALVDEVLAAYAQASRPPAHQAKGKSAAAGQQQQASASAVGGVLKKLEDVRRRGRKRDCFG